MLTKWIHIDDKDKRFNLRFIQDLLYDDKVVYACKNRRKPEKVLITVRADDIDWLVVSSKPAMKISLEWYDYISYRDWIWK